MISRVILFVLLFSFQQVFAQEDQDIIESRAPFSMFIHWGLYSELGGVWQEKEVSGGGSELIQALNSIKKEEYVAVARRFHPEKWNAGEIVKLAKLAGMRSVIFTVKHHDGFCMYDSRQTDFDIVEATPFKRDVLKELAEACQAGGIKLGVYFSVLDWYFLGKANPNLSDSISSALHQRNLQQVEELLNGYGEITEFWFDGGILTEKQSRELSGLVKKIQPHCKVSSQVSNNQGDFFVWDRRSLPSYKIGVPWKMSASFYPEGQGYTAWQKREGVERKMQEKLLELVKVVGRGGDYVLSVGPDGTGAVVDFERQVLLKMGYWMRRYGMAIYDTEANPFGGIKIWGEMTKKANKLYLFIHRLPKNRKILLQGVRGEALKASLVGGRFPLRMEQLEDTLSLFVPETVYPEWGMWVVEVEFRGNYRIIPSHGLIEKSLDDQNSYPVYTFSQLNTNEWLRSVIERRWFFQEEEGLVRPEIIFTHYDRGKQILLKIDGEEHLVGLFDGEKEMLSVSPGSVRWNEVYQGMVEEESFIHDGFREGYRVDLLDTTQKMKWGKVYRFHFGEYKRLAVKPKQTIYLLFDIESDVKQEVLVEMSYPDALHVMLNGRTLRKRISVGRPTVDRDLVRLPLRKGKNQLLVRFYNQSGKQLEYGINPNVSQYVYRLRMSAIPLFPTVVHECSIRLANPLNQNDELGLHDLKIEM